MTLDRAVRCSSSVRRRSGKTSSLVVPALLRWSDALVVTSVKNDVVATTRQWRETLGEVQVLEPGRDGGLTWDPLEGVTTLRHAIRVARDLTIGSSDRGDTEFWNSLADEVRRGLDDGREGSPRIDLRRRRRGRTRDVARLAGGDRVSDARRASRPELPRLTTPRPSTAC